MNRGRSLKFDRVRLTDNNGDQDRNHPEPAGPVSDEMSRPMQAIRF